MDEVQDQIETLIDDIERDSSITKAEILLTLYKLKEKIVSEDENDNGIRTILNFVFVIF